MRILYYNPLFLPDSTLPGMRRFARYASHVASGKSVMFLDRSGTIRTPLATTSLYPIPPLRPFKASYEDVCDVRARELLAHMGRLGTRMYLLYSGGIDSTCMTVSLLKTASPAERENITILLTEQSIKENPRFFSEHLWGKVACEPAAMFPYLLGTDIFIVSAELNDLVFGSDFVRPFMKRYGFEVVRAPFDQARVQLHFASLLAGTPHAERDALFFVDQLIRLREVSPVPLESHFDVFWWASFCLKWQFISLRILSLTPDRHRNRITKAYARDYFTHFYDTEDFQLWSMNNLNKRIKDDWRTYKWPSKEVIYGYTKDAEYRDNKTKRGSLGWLFLERHPFHIIDEHYGLYRDVSPAEYYESENDFT